MTLDQYLGTVAWLFMAFLMWFSVRNARHVIYELDDMDLFWFFKSIDKDHKLEASNFLLVLFVFGPTALYTFCWSMFLLPLLLT